MNEHQFKKLLIDLINMDSYPDKEALVALIKISTIDFVKTSEFARRGVWDQCQEYIYFSTIPDKLMELKKHEKYIEKKCEELYPISKDYALFGIIFKPGAMSQEEDISQEIVFENIRNQIVEELQNAKYDFLRAIRKFMEMRTLTPVILRELIEKIEVFPVEGTGKDRTQRVIIHYRFVGTLDIPGIIHRPPYILDSRKGVAIEYLSNAV